MESFDTSSSSSSSSESSAPAAPFIMNPPSPPPPPQVQRTQSEVALIEQATHSFLSIFDDFNIHLTPTQNAYYYSQASQSLLREVDRNKLKSYKRTFSAANGADFISDVESMRSFIAPLAQRYPSNCQYNGQRAPSVFSGHENGPFDQSRQLFKVPQVPRKRMVNPPPAYNRFNSSILTYDPEPRDRHPPQEIPNNLLRAIRETAEESQVYETSISAQSRMPRQVDREIHNRNKPQPVNYGPSESSEEPAPPAQISEPLAVPKQTQRSSSPSNVVRVFQWRLKLIKDELELVGFNNEGREISTGPIQKYARDDIVVTRKGSFHVEGQPVFTVDVPDYVECACAKGFPTRWRTLLSKWLQDRRVRRKSGTPGKKTGTPGKKTGTPGKKTGTPGQKRGTPAQKRGTPAQKRGTPAQKRGTPGRAAKKPRNSSSGSAKSKPKRKSYTPVQPRKKPRSSNPGSAKLKHNQVSKTVVKKQEKPQTKKADSTQLTSEYESAEENQPTSTNNQFQRNDSEFQSIGSETSWDSGEPDTTSTPIAKKKSPRKIQRQPNVTSKPAAKTTKAVKNVTKPAAVPTKKKPNKVEQKQSEKTSTKQAPTKRREANGLFDDVLAELGEGAFACSGGSMTPNGLLATQTNSDLFVNGRFTPPIQSIQHIFSSADRANKSTVPSTPYSDTLPENPACKRMAKAVNEASKKAPRKRKEKPPAELPKDLARFVQAFQSKNMQSLNSVKRAFRNQDDEDDSELSDASAYSSIC